VRSKVLLFNLPPLGGDLFPVSLGYIAASLARRNIDSMICEIDADSSLSPDDIREFILDYQPTVVGLAIYQINVRLAVKLARLVKSCDPAIVVAVGGPQATFMPKDALAQMPCVDVIVRGEGETVLPDLVTCVARRRNAVRRHDVCRRGGVTRQHTLARVRGIAFRDAAGIHETAPPMLVRNLDRFPSPYQTGVFRWSDHSGAAMLTSRGCTYACGFCYTPRAFGRTIRTHSVRRVLADMSACVRHGKRRFFFADPSFTFDKKRVQSIMRGIIKRRWKIEIWCETRTDLVDAPLLALMAAAGVKRIAYGLESVDPVVNKALHKPIEPRHFAATIRMTQRAGIEAEIFTLYGLPQQTRESALHTLRFVQSLGVEIAHNSSGQQLHLFFGTNVLAHPREYGIRMQHKRRPAYVSPGTDFETEWMSKKDIAFVARKYRAAHFPSNK